MGLKGQLIKQSSFDTPTLHLSHSFCLRLDHIERYSPCILHNIAFCEQACQEKMYNPSFCSKGMCRFESLEIIQEQVADMERRGIIERSFSPWALPVVLVKKPDGTWRFCVDYRKLNSVTKMDLYPIPKIEAVLSKLRRHSLHITRFGIRFRQIPVRKEDREKTTFITSDGLIQSITILHPLISHA